MLKRTLTYLSFFSFLLCSSTVLASLFKVSSSGIPANATIELCLDGTRPTGCEQQKITRNTLSIRTETPKRTYPQAGIKVLTPGYGIDYSKKQCTKRGSYCLFSVSKSEPVTISLTEVTQQFIVTPEAGINGSISPNSSISVTKGDSVALSAIPNSGFIVDSWYVDKVLFQVGGRSFNHGPINAHHNIKVTFKTPTTQYYAGGLNGAVYTSNDEGELWHELPTHPAGTNAVNALFATKTALYVGSADGKVYVTTDAGTTWQMVSNFLDDGAINSLFISGDSLYVATSGGHVWRSVNNENWEKIGDSVWGDAPVRGLFVNGTDVYVGAKNGVFKSSNGQPWIQQFSSADTGVITALYVVNDSIYYGTSNENVYINTNGTSVLFAQSAFSLFVNADASSILAGTQGGYLYSLSKHSDLGYITPTPINSVFQFN